jgi:hypothetical protein
MKGTVVVYHCLVREKEYFLITDIILSTVLKK